ncbi:MAG: ribonuclease Y [Candidatus Latescibacterota bacterium]|jgi:ribonuclease Y
MPLVGIIALVLTAFAAGILLGWLVCDRARRRKLDTAQAAARKLVEQAALEAEALKRTAVLEARDEWRSEREPLERELEADRRALRELEARLVEREQQLDRKVDLLESKEATLVKTEQEQEQREATIAADETRLTELVRQQNQRLEELAGLTQAEARQTLIRQLEHSARQFASRKVREIKDSAIALANLEAKEIIVRSVQRFAGELAVESTVTVVPIPSDDMKGRIIGRDGRNIRSFEMITGVEVIVDDTPGIVMLSGFDPLRREIAMNTLLRLIQDGRIHPGRIEEVYAKASQDTEEMIRESGSKAAFDLGIHDLAEPLLEALGQLRFRTSYGQNLLEHSKEVGLLAGMMAEELDLDAALARRAGLLHDIGKAFSYEVGTDAGQASAALARKSGEGAEVVQVIETLNQNLPVRSAIAVLVSAANEISRSRPGARKEKIEDYLRRLRQIEEIAQRQTGVRQAFALQNGKEIRVLVDSETVDDAYADQLADEITDQLEKELDHPGQIRVCVIREVRAVHYAR